MTEQTTPLFTIEGHLASITLNAPQRHNALEQADMQALISAFDEIEKTPAVRALILTGAGEKTFCAGASLQQVGDRNLRTHLFSDLTNRLENLTVPTICALNGSVYGGGVELALCCDYRIGLQGTRMFVPAAKFGLCYRPEGLQRYVTRLGIGPTKRLLIANETFSADEMYRLGYLDYLLERDELKTFSYELAQHIAGLGPLAVQGMKRLINQITLGRLDEVEAAAILEQCANSEDLQEGFKARAEKRDPVFKGR